MAIHCKHELCTSSVVTNYYIDMDLFGDAFEAFDYNQSNDLIAFPTDDYKYTPAPALFSPALAMSRTTSQSTNLETISPQELSLRDPVFSAPSSTAFPNLTSPSSFEDSPFMDDSPMFHGDALPQQDDWFSLFPSTVAPTTEEPAPQTLEASPYLHVEQLDTTEEQITFQEQREVSQQINHRRTSSGSPGGRASQSAGVSASRRRNQPLPPIIVEDKNDTVAMKRARNTLAARKSRQKKMEKFEELEAELAAMTADRDKWKALALARSTQ